MDGPDHNPWVEDLHAGFHTPPELLREVVTLATGAGIAGDERIVEGEINEVHAITTTKGHEIVVRVGHGAPTFTHEIWPIQQARRVGVPAPEVLLVHHATDGHEHYSFSIQRRLPGRSAMQQLHSFGDADLAALTRAVGGLLAQLHAVPVPGWGRIGPHGELMEGPNAAQRRWPWLERRAQFVTDTGVDPALLDTAMRLVDRWRPVLDDAAPVLIHGDWGLPHFIVDHGQLTGVVDWESSGGGDPARDIAWWDLWFDGPPHPTDVLLAGYREVASDDDPLFDVRRWCHGIELAISSIARYTELDAHDLVDRLVGRLQRRVDDLARVGSPQ